MIYALWEAVWAAIGAMLWLFGAAIALVSWIVERVMDEIAAEVDPRELRMRDEELL